MIPPRRYLDGDWYPGGVPGNVVSGRDVYLDTSYAFAAFHSIAEPGLVLGDACGVYDRSNFVVGPAGQATVGPFTCLNATTVVCNHRVTIGAYCLLAWGVVITDTWCPAVVPIGARRAALRAAAADALRLPPVPSEPSSVVLEDNVWVGFDAVILPGVTLGRGCVVGCRSVVYQDIPPYSVVVGNPARRVRQLDPDDTDEARRAALACYLRETPVEGSRA
jgi:acetyltransferase-like isoleucine patch superfamily enzyme